MVNANIDARYNTQDLREDNSRDFKSIICTDKQGVKDPYIFKTFEKKQTAYLSFPSTIPAPLDLSSPIDSGGIISYVALCFSHPSYETYSKNRETKWDEIKGLPWRVLKSQASKNK